MTTRICQLFIVVAILYQSSLADIPNCVFEDTVALTNSTKFANGSYLYEGLLVPPHLTAEYDYIELFEGERKPVERHVRGCVCKIKQCVKFCCHPKADMYQTSDAKGCEEELNEELRFSPLLNVTLRNSSRVMMHLLDEFVMQQGIPCADGYMLMPHVYKDEQWELFENGTLLRLSNAKYYSRRDYCLQAYNTGEEFVLNPMNCPVHYKEPATHLLNTIIMLISAPFLYVTILIYWLIPELWNLHTKCLICYLLSLAIGTTLIVVVNMSHSDLETFACAIIGFVSYFFLTAVFFWLNVICFDLWQNFRMSQGAVRNLTQRKRFLYYSLYAWGMPALMTIITATLQFSNLPHELKSGIGDTHCWLKIDDWAAMIYFHGPCLLLIIFNIGIFFLTANKIYEIRKELQHFSRSDCSQRHLRSQQNNKHLLESFSVWLFFRMFIVMGIGWLLEIISYMVGNNSKYVLLFGFTDVYNASQGLIIFILLVVKKKVLLLIKKRFTKSDNNLLLSTRRHTKSSTSAMELSNAESRWKLRN